jgi:hypothetical protein
VHEHTTDKAKRRKARELIEQELYTYEQSRREIERRIAEIDDIASPPSNWPPIGRVSGEKGDVVAFMEASRSRECGLVSDPTADRAQKVSDYREKILGSKQFQEMYRRVKAIETVLGWLQYQWAQNHDIVQLIKLRIVERKYFNREPDETIWTELGISRTTFYRYRLEILQEIADELGWVV